MKQSTRSWLELTKEDIFVIKSIMNSEFAAGAASFHAQQCIEKCLKAILEEFQSTIPKIHDLDKLLNQVNSFIKLNYDATIVDKLNLLYIESRYPGAFAFLPSGKPSMQNGDKFQISRRVHLTLTECIFLYT